MKKQYLALLLVLALLAGLLTGCASKADSEPAATAAAEPIAEPAAPSEPKPEAAEPEAVSEPEEAPAPETVPGSATLASVGEADLSSVGDAALEVEHVETASTGASAEASAQISYPLDGDSTFTVYKAFESNMLAGLMGSYYDNLMLSTVNEMTGVTLEFDSPSSASASEQFNLMIASGDYPTFMDCAAYYTGGLSKALEEDIICDLTPYVEEWCPAYWDCVLNSNEATYKAVTDDEHNILCLYTINNIFVVERGLQIRADWVEGVGMELPRTTQELYDVLVAIKEKYDPAKPFAVDSSGVMDYVVGAFGIPGYGVSSTSVTSTGLGNYLDESGTTVLCTLQSEGLRDYIDYLRSFIDAGIVDGEFYSQGGMMGSSNATVAAGENACWFSMSDSIAAYYQMTEDPNFTVAALPGIVKEVGDTYNFAGIPERVGRNNLCISTACDDLEKAMNYINWFFTEEAFIPCNFGQEGVSFEYDENGEPYYTDAILNNPVTSRANAQQLYCFAAYMPLYLDKGAFQKTSTALELEAQNTWTAMSSSQTLPTVSYTAAESDVRTNLVTDLNSYATETVLKWIIGAELLNDDTWAAFQGVLDSMGIRQVLDIDQAAYERYEAR